MSRSGYCDDMDDNWALIRWRGAVASAIRGARGQAFLKEMLAALNRLPEPKLIANELEKEGEVCALGAVGKARGMDMTGLDPEETGRIAKAFGIPEALAKEIVYMNDEWLYGETPEARYLGMHRWVNKKLRGAGGHWA